MNMPPTEPLPDGDFFDAQPLDHTTRDDAAWDDAAWDAGGLDAADMDAAGRNAEAWDVFLLDENDEAEPEPGDFPEEILGDDFAAGDFD